MLRSCRGGGRREITKFSVCASLDIGTRRQYISLYIHTPMNTRYLPLRPIICTCLHPCSFVKNDMHFHTVRQTTFSPWSLYIYISNEILYIPQIKDAYRNHVTFAVKKHSSFSINMFIFYHGSMEPSYLHTSLNIVQMFY